VGGAAPAADQDQRQAERLHPRTAALIAYFDSSAFVKLFVDEPGSAHAAATWDAADRRLSTRILYAEARAALAAATRARRIEPTGLVDVRAQLEFFWARLDPVEPRAHIVAHAGDLAEAHALRAYDAIHLASAEAVANEETWFVAADDRLLAAAQAQGLTTVTLAE